MSQLLDHVTTRVNTIIWLYAREQGKKSPAKEKRYFFFTETPNLKRNNWKESILARVLERFVAYESQSPLKMLLYLLVLF